MNISTRGSISTGDPLIAGFVIGGPVAKRVLVRAVGPGLIAQGLSTALANPRLTLFRDQTVVKENDDWFRDAEAASISAAAAASGAFALGAESLDAAILMVLEPGAYTAHVESVTTAAGVALVEVYEVP